MIDYEERGLNYLSTLNEQVVSMMKRDVYALLQNNVLYLLEKSSAALKTINGLEEWNAHVEFLKNKADFILDFSQKTLHIDPEEDPSLKLMLEYIDLVKNNKDMGRLKKNVEATLDQFIKRVSEHLTPIDNKFMSEYDLKMKLEWDVNKPLNIVNICAGANNLTTIINELKEVFVEELQHLHGYDDTPEIREIKEKLTMGIEEITNGKHRIIPEKKEAFKDLMRRGIKMIIDKGRAVDVNKCSYPITTNMCLDVNLIYKFMNLFQIYESGNTVQADRDGDDTAAVTYPLKNPGYYCKDSAYNKYYDNLFDTLNKYIMDFTTVPLCHPVRKNIYYFIFIIIHRIKNEIFADPYSVVVEDENDSLDRAKNTLDTLEIVVDVDDNAAKAMLQLSSIIQMYGDVEPALKYKALLLYHKYRTKFINNIQKQLSLTYTLLDRRMNECPLHAVHNPNSPLYGDQVIYNHLVKFIGKERGILPSSKMDEILSSIMSLENKYSNYISYNSLVPPPIAEDDDDDDDPIKQRYKEFVEECKQLWEGFKMYITGYDKGIFACGDEESVTNLTRYIDRILEDEGEDKILLAFKGLLVNSLWKDADSLKKEIRNLKAEVETILSDKIASDHETLKGIVEGSSATDETKKNILIYMENARQIDDNLRRIDNEKGVPDMSVIEAIVMNADDRKTIEDYRRRIEEIDLLKKRLADLETLKESYDRVVDMLGSKEIVGEIENLMGRVERSEEALRSYETEMKALEHEKAMFEEELMHTIKNEVWEESRREHETTVKQYSDKIESLTENKQRLDEKLQSLQRQLDENCNKSNILADAIGEERGALSGALESIRKNEEEWRELEGDSKTYAMGISHIESIIKNLSAAMERENDRWMSHQDAMTNQADERMGKLTRAIAQMDNRVAELAVTIEKARDAHEQSINQLYTLYSNDKDVEMAEKALENISSVKNGQRVLSANEKALAVLGDENGAVLKLTNANDKELRDLFNHVHRDMCTVFDKYNITVSNGACGDTPFPRDEGEEEEEEEAPWVWWSRLKEGELPELLELINGKDVAITELRGKIKEYETDVNSVNALLESKTREYDALEKRYLEIIEENERTALQEQRADRLATEIGEYQQNKKSCEETIKKLTNENKILRAYQDKLRHVIGKSANEDPDNLINEVQMLVDNKDTISRNIQSLIALNEELVQKHAADIQDLRDECSRQEKKRSKVNNELNAALEKSHAIAQGKYESFEKELEECMRVSKMNESIIDNIKNDTSVLKVQYNNERENSELLRDKVSKLQILIDQQKLLLDQCGANEKNATALKDGMVERVHQLELQRNELLREKNSLLGEIMALQERGVESTSNVITEIDNLAQVIAETGTTGNYDSNQHLLRILRNAQAYVRDITTRNIEYMQLVEEYEARSRVYEENRVEQKDLRERYKSLQKAYSDALEKVKKCDGNLIVELQARDANQNIRIKNLLDEIERLKKECGRVQRETAAAAAKTAAVVSASCDELLKRAYDRRKAWFGDNINDIIAKTEKKINAINTYSGRDRNVVMKQLAKLNKANLRKDLSLPADCSSKGPGLMDDLQNIDQLYETSYDFINRVDDLFSDTYQLGRIYIRLKPPVSSGTYTYNTGKPVVTLEPSQSTFGKSMICMSENQSKCFAVDQYFDEDVTNKDIYNAIESALNGVKNNKHVFIVVYGQTGSGKSYSVTGGANDPGLLYYIYEYAKSLGTVKLKLYGLYHDRIYDLTRLKKGEGYLRKQSDTPPLEARVNRVSECNVLDNISYIKLKDLVDGVAITRQTKFNDRSSRAHMFIDIYIPEYEASLVIVDLCGNEKTSALDDGEQVRKESIYINSSLLSFTHDFLKKFRARVKHTTGGSLKRVIDGYVRDNNIKLNSIFHCHKYLTDNHNVNNMITTSTISTLQTAEAMSTI